MAEIRSRQFEPVAATAMQSPGSTGITVVPYDGTVEVLVGETVVACSTRGRSVREDDGCPLLYLPLEDIDDSVLRRSPKASYCPIKGAASFWTVKVGQTELSDALWGYLDPATTIDSLRDYVAFYVPYFTVRIDGEVVDLTRPDWNDRDFQEV